MKNRIKTTLKLTLICSLFFFLSCEKDLYEEQIIKQTKATSEKISINQVLSEISNPLIKDYINDVLQQELGLSQFRTSSQDYFNFIKIIKQDNYTTYSLLLNGYSDDKPYFKYFIITKEGITERAGYFKYIPDNEELVFNEKELNGKIQVLDVENNIKGETKFISSQPQPPLSTQSIDCVDTFDIITHNCTNGGNHPPGVPCGGGAINNGYYEIVVITTCTISSDYHYIAPPIDFMGVSSSTGGGYMLSQNINVLQYIFSLTEEQYSILQQNPSLVTYLENNDASPESNNFVTWAINAILVNLYSSSFINEAFNALNNNFEVDFSKNIIYGINKPCQKQIVKDIIDVCSPFTELIQQTFNSTDNVNIKFYNGNLPNGNAYTNPNYIGNTQNFTIRIKFDDTFLNTGTNLSIVAVTLHELVHAYLMNLYLKGTLVATNSEYNTLQNAFIAFYNNQVQDTFDPLDNEIHNAMDDFISNMANSIYNYALTKNISVTADYCEKLAWGTMSGTDLFIQSLTPEQQIENNNIFAYEQDNILPQAKGTPCN